MLVVTRATNKIEKEEMHRISKRNSNTTSSTVTSSSGGFGDLIISVSNRIFNNFASEHLYIKEK